MEINVFSGLWQVSRGGIVAIPWLMMSFSVVYHLIMSLVLFSLGRSNSIVEQLIGKGGGILRPIPFVAVNLLAAMSIVSSLQRLFDTSDRLPLSGILILGVLAMIFTVLAVLSYIPQRVIAIIYAAMIILMGLLITIEFGTLIFIVPACIGLFIGYLASIPFGDRLSAFLTRLLP